jgi:hypothetical protein
MSSIAQVEQVFQDAVERLHKLANSNDATPAQSQQARTALNDLLLLHGTQVLQDIEGRTSILSGLIAELEAVTDGIRGAGQLKATLDQITTVLQNARDLYRDAKAQLRAG